MKWEILSIFLISKMDFTLEKADAATETPSDIDRLRPVQRSCRIMGIQIDSALGLVTGTSLPGSAALSRLPRSPTDVRPRQPALARRW